MRDFKDSAGTAWQLDLNIGEVLRVKTASDGRFNLLDPESQPGGECGARELRSVINTDETNDYATLYELLFLLVEPAARQRNIDAPAFAALIRGGCIVAARDALIKEWADFFHQLQRPDKAAALERMVIYNAKALEKVTAKLKSPEMEALDATVSNKMDALLSEHFGKLAESLASTPAPSPGESSTPCAMVTSETSEAPS